MMTGLHIRNASITGATGLIGRWLLVELTQHGVHVSGFIRRSSERRAELRAWVDARGGRGELVDTFELDLDADDLGLTADGRARLLSSEAVYHLAARFGLGLARVGTQRSNVHASVRLVRLLGQAPALERLVHISGYRTAGGPAQVLDVDDEAALNRFYVEHGAYEASKMEAHVRVRRAAVQLSVPLTIISPAMVIGDSRTGETTQQTGLAETIGKMWRGELAALAGTRDTWLPVVPVDFLASLLARLPDDPASTGDHIVVFDDRTPTLPKLLALAASRMDNRAPTRVVPVSLLRKLPSTITGVHSESLSFISDDRYDPKPLDELCQRLHLRLPDVSRSLERWVDHLIDTRFGAREASGATNHTIAGTRIFARGDRGRARAVFLHGVMLNEHSWTPITNTIDAPVLVPDLPGLGRSEAGGGTPNEWMTSLLSTNRTRPVIVGHSLGTAFAVDFAHSHPDRVAELVLVSPFFLQTRPAWPLRQAWLVRAVFRLSSAKRLAGVLNGPLDDARADAVELLRRRSVAHHNARWLSWAATLDVRQRLREQLARVSVPVTLVVGEHDPLIAQAPAGARIVTIDGAGHHPQLTHADQVSDVVRRALRRHGAARRRHEVPQLANTVALANVDN